MMLCAYMLSTVSDVNNYWFNLKWVEIKFYHEVLVPSRMEPKIVIEFDKPSKTYDPSDLILGRVIIISTGHDDTNLNGGWHKGWFFCIMYKYR